MGTIKRFHLDKDATDLPEGMGIGAGARCDSCRLAWVAGVVTGPGASSPVSMR